MEIKTEHLRALSTNGVTYYVYWIDDDISYYKPIADIDLRLGCIEVSMKFCDWINPEVFREMADLYNQAVKARC